MARIMRGKWVHFTPEVIKQLEKAVVMGYASDANAAIRDAVRDYLKELELWRSDKFACS